MDEPYRVVQTRWQMRPRPQARSRSTRRGGHYTPAAVLEAQAQVATLHYGYRGTYPAGTLVALELTFRCYRWRGDFDNLAKLITDALRDHRLAKLRDGTVLEGAGVYHDDRQIKRAVVQVHKVADAAQEGVSLHMHTLPKEAPWL